jgi:voltage-gated potassium channel Kch
MSQRSCSISAKATPTPKRSVRFRALRWPVMTLTTAGYGDVYPDSPIGRVAAALVALAGHRAMTGILASLAEQFRDRADKPRKPPAE